MKERSTIDVVVIMFTGMIAVVLILSVIGVFVMRFSNPAVDTSRAGEAIQGIITTIVGALVGFIGGRAQGKYEASNGVK